MITSPYNAILQTNGKVIHTIEVETNITEMWKHTLAHDTERERDRENEKAKDREKELLYCRSKFWIHWLRITQNQKKSIECVLFATNATPNERKKLYRLSKSAHIMHQKKPTFVKEKTYQNFYIWFTYFAVVLADTKHLCEWLSPELPEWLLVSSALFVVAVFMCVLYLYYLVAYVYASQSNK